MLFGIITFDVEFIFVTLRSQSVGEGIKINPPCEHCEEPNEVLINLASNEYSKVLKLNKIKSEVITPVFKDYKNGKLKVISFFAKKARGEMVNFIIKNKITSFEELKLFKNNGYAFSDENNADILFVR